MAEEKSFYRKTVDYLQKPPQRIDLKRGPLDKYEQSQGSVWAMD